MAVNEDSVNLLKYATSLQFDSIENGLSPEQVKLLLVKLPPIADELERLGTRLTEAELRARDAEKRLLELHDPEALESNLPKVSRDFDETLRNTLVTAQRQADALVADAQAEVERLLSEAKTQAETKIAEAESTAIDTRSLIETERSQSLAEIEIERTSEREKILSEATELRETLTAELTEAHLVKREQLLQDIDLLSETHQLLVSDVERFEDHLAKRRTEVRVALTELTEILENPEKLSVVDPLQAVETADLTELREASTDLDSTSLADLEADLSAATQSFSPESEVAAELLEDPFVATSEVSDDAQVYIELDSETVETEDPYLAELEKVTQEDIDLDDPLNDFLTDDESSQTGWFGRRKA